MEQRVFKRDLVLDEFSIVIDSKLRPRYFSLAQNILGNLNRSYTRLDFSIVDKAEVSHQTQPELSQVLQKQLIIFAKVGTRGSTRRVVAQTHLQGEVL